MATIDHSITNHQGLVGETNLASGSGSAAAIASQLSTKANLISTPTNLHIVQTNGSGQSIDSGKVFSTDVTLGGGSSSNNNISTQLAVKTYVDGVASPSGVSVYNSLSTYNSQNLVSYLGSIWQCLTNSTSGITPSNSSSNWAQVVSYVNPDLVLVNGANGFNSKNGLLPFDTITNALVQLPTCKLIQLLESTTEDLTISSLNFRLTGCGSNAIIHGTMVISNSGMQLDNIALNGNPGIDTLTLGNNSRVVCDNLNIGSSSGGNSLSITNNSISRYDFSNCNFNSGNINIAGISDGGHSIVIFNNCNIGGVLFNNTDAVGIVANGCGNVFHIRNNGFVIIDGVMIISLASTINIASLSGTQTIDGVSTTTNKLVWLNGQTTPSENGLWQTSGSGAWLQIFQFSDVDAYQLFYGPFNLFIVEGTTLAHSYIDFKRDSSNAYIAYSQVLTPL